MRLGYDLTIEQSQRLIMTPELIQAIQILQFNTQELDSFVQEQLLTNPVLEPAPHEEERTPEGEVVKPLDEHKVLSEYIRERGYDDPHKQPQYSTIRTTPLNNTSAQTLPTGTSDVQLQLHLGAEHAEASVGTSSNLWTKRIYDIHRRNCRGAQHHTKTSAKC
jgi:DNA-directed RNA polymerase specialized sigma54-like protein